jgi:hypothetical protein
MAKARAALDILKGGETGTNERSDAFTPVKVWYFLNKFHPTEVDAWLENFIEDSITAYDGNPSNGDNTVSCPGGITERVFLGLRAIDDETIRQIFGVPESIKLVSLFLISCNFGDDKKPDNVRFVAKGLKELGITKDSTSQAAQANMREFMENGIRQAGGDPSLHKADIDLYVSLIEVFFDEKIKPHL